MEKNRKQGKKRRPWPTWRKLPVLAAAGLVLGMGIQAEAKDGGGEEVVPINTFTCVACGFKQHTFAPDTLVLRDLSLDADNLAKAAKLGLEGDKRVQEGFKTFHQEFVKKHQARLLQFKNVKPLPPCEKPFAGINWGVHIFKAEGSTQKKSPSFVHDKIMEGMFALEWNHRQLEARYDRWECIVCPTKFYSFQGDDLDMLPPIEFDKPMKLFRFFGYTHMNPCNVLKWANDTVTVQHHIVRKTGYSTITDSLSLRRDALDGKVYFSH